MRMEKEIINKENLEKKHILIDKNLYHELWKIAVKRFDKPSRKIWILINEALREYVEKHKE